MVLRDNDYCSFCDNTGKKTIYSDATTSHICVGCVDKIVKFLAEKSLLPPDIVIRDKRVDSLKIDEFLKKGSFDGNTGIPMSLFMVTYSKVAYRMLCHEKELDAREQAIDDYCEKLNEAASIRSNLQKKLDDSIAENDRRVRELIEMAFGS
jgi:hypothetical protein